MRLSFASCVFLLLAVFCVLCAASSSAAGVNLGPQPKVTVLASPQPLPPAAEEDVPSLTAPAVRALANDAPWRAGETGTPGRLSPLRKAAGMGDAASAQMLGEIYFKGRDENGRDIGSDGVAAYTWFYLARHGFSRPAAPKKDEEENYASPLNFLGWTLTLQEERQVEKALAAWPETLPPEAPARVLDRRLARDCEEQRFDSPAPPGPQDMAALEARAASGDNAAKISLGDAYYNGWGAPKDAARGFALYKAAADAGDVMGLRVMAHFYTNPPNDGTDRKRDVGKAQEIYEKLAEKGDPLDQILLGEFFLGKWLSFGYGGKDDAQKAADQKTAVEWFTKAANQGSVVAMMRLGMVYDGRESGGVDKRDYDQATVWYERAGAAGGVGALDALISIAESRRDMAGLYKWISIRMSCMPVWDRMNARVAMLEFLNGLPDEKVRRLKEDADKWLKDHPGAQKAAAEREAAMEACYKAGDKGEGAIKDKGKGENGTAGNR